MGKTSGASIWKVDTFTSDRDRRKALKFERSCEGDLLQSLVRGEYYRKNLRGLAVPGKLEGIGKNQFRGKGGGQGEMVRGLGDRRMVGGKEDGRSSKTSMKRCGGNGCSGHTGTKKGRGGQRSPRVKDAGLKGTQRRRRTCSEGEVTSGRGRAIEE